VIIKYRLEGCHSVDNYNTDASVDDIRLFKRALSNAEIEAWQYGIDEVATPQNGVDTPTRGEGPALADYNHYDYGFRIYNPRIAKFLSVDPLTKEYPWYTPYQFAGNKPIMAIDLDGLEEKVVIYDYGSDKPRLYFTDNNSEGKDAISYYYSVFSDRSDLTKEYRFAWDKGFNEYVENKGPNSYGTLVVKQDMGGTYNLSYSRYIAKAYNQIMNGFKQGYKQITADTRGNRVGKRMTLAIATSPLAVGRSVLAGLEMAIVLNEIGSSGEIAFNGELESSYNALRSLITEYAGEAGGEYYDKAETAIKASSFIRSSRNVFKIKTWDDALKEGTDAIYTEIDLMLDYYNKYFDQAGDVDDKEDN